MTDTKTSGEVPKPKPVITCYMAKRHYLVFGYGEEYGGRMRSAGQYGTSFGADFARANGYGRITRDYPDDTESPGMMRGGSET